MLTTVVLATSSVDVANDAFQEYNSVLKYEISLAEEPNKEMSILPDACIKDVQINVSQLDDIL